MPNSPLHLGGVVPPLVTPLDEHGELDRASLERLVGFQLDAGVEGLFVGGSSGEVALLDSGQRREALEVVVGVAAGAVPVLAGAIDTGTRRVIEQARAAERLGVDGVVTTAPFYVKPNHEEIVAHFRQVHAAVNLPVVAYDIPGAVVTRLTPDVVAELADRGFAVACKDSSGDLASFREILRRTEVLAFDVLTGSELFADVALELGASGVVPGVGNVDPHGYVRMVRAARAGDHGTARAEQRRLTRLFDIVAVADRGRVGPTAGALGSFKAALALRGVIAGAATAAPLSPLNEVETREIAKILDELDLARV